MEDDRFEEWERYPADRAQEQLEQQKLAWYAAPWADAGIAVVVLAIAAGLLRRLGREAIRLAARFRLV